MRAREHEGRARDGAPDLETLTESARQSGLAGAEGTAQHDQVAGADDTREFDAQRVHVGGGLDHRLRGNCESDHLRSAQLRPTKVRWTRGPIRVTIS